jgi:hypothetical protein
MVVVRMNKKKGNKFVGKTLLHWYCIDIATAPIKRSGFLLVLIAGLRQELFRVWAGSVAAHPGCTVDKSAEI